MSDARRRLGPKPNYRIVPVCILVIYTLLLGIGSLSLTDMGPFANAGPVQVALSPSTIQSTPPTLEALPSRCPSVASVSLLVNATYPQAHFDPAYQIGTDTCAAAPTLVFPSGEQLAIVISGGTITSTHVLVPRIFSSRLVAGTFSRWSGFEPYSRSTAPLFGLIPFPNDRVVTVAADRVVPSISLPDNYWSENGTMKATCCALSIWVGQTATSGGKGDGKLIQIGINMMLGRIKFGSRYGYSGFYEALPSGATYFNSTQVPCGMPRVGQAYTTTVTNQGALNASMWRYALTFRNDACGGGDYYVVYTDYAMDGSFGEVQSEAPEACYSGLLATQDQLPKFTGDDTKSVFLSFQSGDRPLYMSLGETKMNNATIILNGASDTLNTWPENQTGRFSTVWLNSSVASNSLGIC